MSKKEPHKMVTPTIRNNKPAMGFLLSPNIPTWVTLVMLGFIMTIFNVLGTARTEEAALDTTTKTTVEVIHTRPDGSKDFNLQLKKKKNATSFKAFSFYLMGDTPVGVYSLLFAPKNHLPRLQLT
jgi:hypothetical protein